jgi:hypothetical protein
VPISDFVVPHVFLYKETTEAKFFYQRLCRFLSGFAQIRQPGQTDLEQKSSFATEGVQGYGESSANGDRIKNFN